MLVADIARRNAEFFSDNDAIVVPGRPTLSWRDVDEASNRLGWVLLDLGLTGGDRVGVLASNCAEYLLFFFACSKTGIIGAPINIRLAPPEIASYLRYVEPQAIIVSADMADLAERVLRDVPGVRHVVGFGGPHPFETDLVAATAGAAATDPGCAVDAAQPYQLAATSGTTGTAKAAVLTNANAIAAMAMWLAEIPMAEGATSLQTIPLFFNPGGPAGVHPVLLKGGRTVIPPGFDPATFLEAVPFYQVTHTILVPTMIRMVLDHPAAGTTDLSSLRGITCGGSPVSRELLLRTRPVFGDVFYPMYGMAETYSCGLILRPEDQKPDGTTEEQARLGSAGKPAVLLQVRVASEDGTPVAHDSASVGEVWLQGDSVFVEYFRRPEETLAALHEGWFRSGDLATVDREGFVTIVDRLKDIIITGGINVHSREVEEVLMLHPSVDQAAVIGVPHPTWGEAIHAVVTPAVGCTVDVDELIAFAGTQLARYKKPQSIDVRDALPISATGKVLKRLLREPYWQGAERS